MADKTLQQLISEVQQMIYQVAGVSVQTYSQDIIALKIRHAFDFIFADLVEGGYARRYWATESGTLDGTTGKITSTFTTFTRYEDIKGIFLDDWQKPVPHIPSNLNPNSIVGTSAQFHQQDSTAGKLIKILPVTSTGDVTLVGYPNPLTADLALNTTVPMDSMLIVYHAAWTYVSDDGANPAQADRLQGLFEARLKQIKSQQSSPVQLNPYSGKYPTAWYDADR